MEDYPVRNVSHPAYRTVSLLGMDTDILTLLLFLVLLEVLAKYGLVEFVSIVDSIRKGDLRTFNNALVEYQHRFIR